MQKSSLIALAHQQLKSAQQSANGRSAKTVYGGHEHVLRQTVAVLVDRLPFVTLLLRLRGNTEILQRIEALEEKILELERSILAALETGRTS